MAQVTIYLPDKVAARVRRDAKRAGKSISAYIAERIAPAGEETTEWGRKIMKFYGICRDAPIEVPEDPPIEPDDYPKFD